MENLERLLRNKGREQIDISQSDASSSQEFHRIQEFGRETNFKISLLKSKSESDLKEIEINTSRLESYLLDSLWHNLQSSVKTEEQNLVVQIFQPYIPPIVQTPPSFQVPLLVPNPPRQIAARFSPMALPSVLHDFPQYYA